MSRINDGGSAFPEPANAQCGGMSLRDYFAIRAPHPTEFAMDMQRTFDKNRNPYNEQHKPKLRDDYEIVADLSYKYADAMLAARNKESNQ